MSDEYDYDYHKNRADKENPYSTWWLGKIFEKGLQGKEVNLTEAAFWYRKSIALGQKKGILELAIMHYEGNGIRQDYNEAFNLFERIVGEQIVARTYIGIMYHKGQGVKKDYKKAEEYLTKAAENHEYARNYLKLMQKEDKSIDTKVCPKCAETIKKAAIVCRYCSHEFPRAEF